MQPFQRNPMKSRIAALAVITFEIIKNRAANIGKFTGFLNDRFNSLGMLTCIEAIPAHLFNARKD